MVEIIKGPFTNGMRLMHPGEYLTEMWMKEGGLDILSLSVRTGIKIKTLKPITKKKAPVTPEIAAQLSNTLGTTPELWLNLQNTYDQRRKYYVR